jgi:hypothetical protein
VSLAPGSRIGPYEILGSIGAGGMGEVYRGRDHKLGRDVAIKILPPAVADDPDRLTRFAREARLLASLNHPNIGAIYGLESLPAGQAGRPEQPALVLEFVDGESLSDHRAWRQPAGCAPGAVPDAARRSPSPRRRPRAWCRSPDLKPANISVRRGRCQGLFRPQSRSRRSDRGSGVTAQTDVTVDHTRAGVILGTAAT